MTLVTLLFAGLLSAFGSSLPQNIVSGGPMVHPGGIVSGGPIVHPSDIVGGGPMVVPSTH